MTVVYVEPLPKGFERMAITGYAVEDHSGHELKTFNSQKKAIDWALSQGHTVHVAQVHHTDKGNPDHWRKA